MRGQEGENGMTLEIQPKNFKAAAIVFVVVNSISVLIALFSIIMALEMTTGFLGIQDTSALLKKAALLLYGLIWFSLAAYSVLGGALMLMQRYSRLWMSAVIVSIIAGACGLLLGIILHWPAAIWMLVLLMKSKAKTKVAPGM
jgi:hypothetical protein